LKPGPRLDGRLDATKAFPEDQDDEEDV